MLSVEVEATLRLPTESVALPSAIVAITVPLPVMPVTATVYVLPLPLTVPVNAPGAVPEMVTSPVVKFVTTLLKTTVKRIGDAFVGSA